MQDLTPQLRTRLSRVERAVGLFVSLATLLLLAGFAYYVYHTGLRKGWWTFKARYHTFVESGDGLNVGGDVKLLGFNVGKIIEVTAMPPFNEYGAVYVEFYVLDPFQGYIWSDSKARVVAGDFLGGRIIEVLPGGSSLKTDTNAVLHASYKEVLGKQRVHNPKTGNYEKYDRDSKGYGLLALESPAVTARLEAIANQAEAALPGILDMTNRVNRVLSNVISLTAEAQLVLNTARPTLTNIATITDNLKNPLGSLGEWVLPVDLRSQLTQTLGSANVTLTNASQLLASTDTNITTLVDSIDLTLINLANMTSNLTQQVQSNTNILSEISSLIISTDEMIQGLKRHWFLRSAFKRMEAEKARESGPATPAPAAPSAPGTPVESGPPKAGKWRR